MSDNEAQLTQPFEDEVDIRLDAYSFSRKFKFSKSDFCALFLSGQDAEDVEVPSTRKQVYCSLLYRTASGICDSNSGAYQLINFF